MGNFLDKIKGFLGPRYNKKNPFKLTKKEQRELNEAVKIVQREARKRGWID